MFRAISHRTSRALPKPIHLPISHYIHSMQLPFSGSPSYATISQRLSSSQTDPKAFFYHKRQQEAIKSGQFIDIHDVNPEIGLYPGDYDVLLTDITHQKLESRIAEELGIAYLSKATGSDAKKVAEVVDGYIYGPNKRTIIPLLVDHKQQARWVFFILDSGSPWTYTSSQASKILGIDEDTDKTSLATIGGYPTPVRTSPLSSHFADVNLLGTDFCELHNVHVWQDYARRRAKLYFGGEWEMARKSKL